MTTPAENIWDRFQTIPTGIRLWDGQAITGSAVQSTSYRRERPASGTSPIRSDGTRGPRPWMSRGTSETLPLAETRWSQDAAGQYTTVWNGGTIPYQNVMYGGVIPQVPSHLWARADGQALDNAKNQKVNLGQALAEARQTARLVGQTADKIASAVNLYRSKNPKKIWEAVKRGGRHMPQSYLEMSYGWSPLLSDVLGSAEALADAQNRGRSFNLTVRGSASETERFSSRTEWPGLYDLVYEGQTNSRVETVLLYDLPSSLLPSLSSLGLTNPIALQWELVPYSFVVDWFLPIGEYLNRLDAGNYLHFREGSRSVMARLTAYSRYEDRDEFSYRYNKITKTRRPGILRGHSFNRIVLGAPPSIPLPSLRSPLSLGNMAKGLALLCGAFDRNAPRWLKKYDIGDFFGVK